MSEVFPFYHKPMETESEMEKVLKEIDAHISCMQFVRSQIDSYIRIENGGRLKVCEAESSYGKSGYMADVEIDENGEITSIRYDWVES